jgi:hypothetical protein
MQKGVKIVAAKKQVPHTAKVRRVGMTTERIASRGSGHGGQPEMVSHAGANALRAHCIEVWAALHSQEWLCYLLVAEGFYWV